MLARRILVLLVLVACGDAPRPVATPRASSCAACPEWNAPQPAFRVYGNTYYVGPHGLGALLVTSPQGHVLVDGALPESVPGILASIRTLGFRIEDVKLIVSSHVHFDHAGGIAALQRASGAVVAASPSSAAVLRAGSVGRDDPQYGEVVPIAAVANVRTIADGEILHVGPLALTAHFTPGHTAGGTTWTWRACEGPRCLDVVYADSQSPVSADAYLFARHPDVLAAFARSEAVLEALPCDLLVTTHPGASALWERVAAGTLVDPDACRRLAAAARAQLAERVAKELAAGP